MPNEQFNEDIKIEEAINKYGGEDEKYKNTLKQNVRDYLGYSNYVKQMNTMPGVNEPGMKKVMGGGVEQSYLHGDITPSGVRQLVGSGLGLRNQEMGYLQQLAKGADVAGKKKATTTEATKEELDLISKQLGEVGNYPEALMKDWINNPANDDGTFQTVKQFKETLYQHLISGEAGDIGGEKEAREMVEATVNKYLSPEKQEDFQKMYYQSIGYTEKEADNLTKYDRYAKGEMSEAESNLYELTDPTFSQKAEVLKQNPGLQGDLNKLQSNSPDSLPYPELQEKYPNLTPEAVKPVYQRAYVDDLQQMGLSPITEDKETGESRLQDYDVYTEAADELNKKILAPYGGLFSKAEIDYMLWQLYTQKEAEFNALNK